MGRAPLEVATLLGALDRAVRDVGVEAPRDDLAVLVVQVPAAQVPHRREPMGVRSVG